MKRAIGVQTRVWGYVFLLPWIIYMALFLIYPFATAIGNSFMSYDTLDKFRIRFTGLGNWAKVVMDPVFWQSIGNIVYNQAIFIVLTLIISLASAMMLSTSRKLDSVFRTVYFMPVITSLTVGMMVYNYFIVGPDGPIQKLLLSWGWLDKPFIWTVSKTLPMPLIALFSSWKWFGIQMVIFIGGIASIDASVFEAAAIDGASAFARVTRITLPLLRDQLVFVLTMNVINGMQMFTESYMNFETAGGVGNAALTPVLYLYRIAFKDLDMGYASTIGIFLAVIIFIATHIQMKFTEGRQINA